MSIAVGDIQVTISSTTLTIDPSMTLGSMQYTATMASGVIVDTSNNPFGGLSGNTYQFTVDSSAPFVLSFSPAKGSKGHLATASIKLTFNENVQAGTGNIVLTPTTGSALTIPAGDSQVSYSSAIVAINPTASLSTEGVTGMKYTITMAAGVIKDTSADTHSFGGLSGNTYQFTVADTVAPTLTTYSPAQDSTVESAIVNIVLTFSEAVQAGTGNIFVTPGPLPGVTNTAPVSIPAKDSQVSYSSATVTIKLNNWQSGPCTATMASGVIKDLGANAYAGLSGNTYQFTLRGITPSTVVGDGSESANVRETLTFTEGVGLDRRKGADSAKVVSSSSVCSGSPAQGTVVDSNLGPDNTNGAASATAAFIFPSAGMYKVCYKLARGTTWKQVGTVAVAKEEVIEKVAVTLALTLEYRLWDSTQEANFVSAFKQKLSAKTVTVLSAREGSTIVDIEAVVSNATSAIEAITRLRKEASIGRLSFGMLIVASVSNAVPLVSNGPTIIAVSPNVLPAWGNTELKLSLQDTAHLNVEAAQCTVGGLLVQTRVLSKAPPRLGCTMPTVSSPTQSTTISVVSGSNSFRIFTMSSGAGVLSMNPKEGAGTSTSTPVLLTANTELAQLFAVKGVDKSTIQCCFGSTNSSCTSGAKSTGGLKDSKTIACSATQQAPQEVAVSVSPDDGQTWLTVPSKYTYLCPPAKYLSDVGCNICPLGGVCNGGRHVFARPGFWQSRQQVGTPIVYTCQYEGACDGTSAALLWNISLQNASICTNGYQGPLCALCVSGHHMDSYKQCLPCSQISGATIVALVLIVGLLAALVIYIVGWGRMKEKAAALMVARTINPCNQTHRRDYSHCTTMIMTMTNSTMHHRTITLLTTMAPGCGKNPEPTLWACA